MPGKAEFTPRMQTDVRLLRTLSPLSYRRFAGVVADVWSVGSEIGGGGFYLSPDPRIVIFLDDAAPNQILRTHERGPDHSDPRAFYIPPGVPLWCRMEDARQFTHLDFHFEAAALHRRLQAAGIHADLTQPRMIAASSVLTTLGRLAAEEVRAPRRGEAMLDGLFLAALGEIFGVEPAPPPPGALTRYQIAAVERHLRRNLSRHVPVAELAEVAGLSPSWFAHCFRQAQGEAPQRWQARLRLETAREMMADPAASLADIAHATGFSDQAHLSRQFRTAFGQPPSVWRRGGFQAS